MKLSKQHIKPRKDINWKEPKTYIEHLYLTILLWQDIWINEYSEKDESKYYVYVAQMKDTCPLCEYLNKYHYRCKHCLLESCEIFGGTPYGIWANTRRKKYGAYLIYRTVLKAYNEEIKNERT